MAGKSKKQMHPYMDKLMRKLGCEKLGTMAKITGISYTTLARYAYEGCLPRTGDERLCEACGITFAELLSGLANVKPTMVVAEVCEEYQSA